MRFADGAAGVGFVVGHELSLLTWLEVQQLARLHVYAARRRAREMPGRGFNHWRSRAFEMDYKMRRLCLMIGALALIWWVIGAG
jgi:hypothetical protein